MTNAASTLAPTASAPVGTRPMLTGREQVAVGREYARRYVRDTALTKAEYRARLHAIAAELYPAKRYPGQLA